MRTLIYAVSIVLTLICCWTTRAETTNALLTFYTVSEQKIDGGRFIDTAAIPKAGYIAANPDLTVTTLREVYLQEPAALSIMRDTNGNITAVTNTPVPALAVVLLPEDTKRFAVLTEAAVGKRLLVLFGDKPLTAPVVRSPIETGTMVIQFGREIGGQPEAKKVEDELKKLIKR